MGIIPSLPPPPFTARPRVPLNRPLVDQTQAAAITPALIATPGGEVISHAKDIDTKLANVLQKLDPNQRELATCTEQVCIGEAFAGAGKTTTAEAYCLLRPEARVLYLCLNKQNQLEAEARFPKWVDCKTSHSLAFGSEGKHYKTRLVSAWRITKFAAEHNISDMAFAGAVQQTILNYITSADRQLADQHAEPAAAKYSLDPADSASLTQAANAAWKRISSINGTCEVTHDVYLKLWALKNPDLSRYTHIIVDEAQDSNPVIVQVLSQQTNTRMYIGDRHQSIYQFRGSTNAIADLAQQGARVIKIPRTWRFGAGIARDVSRLLHLLKDEDTEIIGCGPSHTSPTKSKAFLSRTNAGLIEFAASQRGIGIHWVGGVEKYAIDILNDAWALCSDNRRDIRDAYMRTFPSWSKYREMAKVTKDVEANMLIRLVDAYKKDVPILVDHIKQRAVPEAMKARAEHHITTAHKAKGLEFDEVILGGDFVKLDEYFPNYLANGLLHDDAGQEINLLYVAMSRARHSVDAGQVTKAFLAKDYAVNLAALIDVKNRQMQTPQTEPGEGFAP